MASSTKLAFLAIAVLLLQASWCAMARRDHDPSPAAVLPQKVNGPTSVMTVTSFENDGEGGGPSACDGTYHSNNELIAALPTGPFLSGDRCHHKITITSNQAGLRTVTAEVVDECDCDDDVIATSKAVWDALGLDTNAGEVTVIWLDA